MNFIGVLIFANTLGSIMAQVCKDTSGKRTCLRSEQLADWQKGYMKDGDPCFSAFSSKMCFIKKNVGTLHQCKCVNGCGCGSAPPTPPPPPAPPKCDNSKVPRRFVKKCTKGYGDLNTMCRYLSMGRNCGRLCNRLLTQEEKQLIVDKHNELRRKVAKGLEPNQPSASNMNQLVWDDELEEVAQRWADQCTFGHDLKRSTLNNPKVGQNVAYYAYSRNTAEYNVTNFVQSWYDEVKDFRSGVDRFTSRRPPNTGVVGHYTALVWAKTTKVGCGFAHYFVNDWYERMFICNYSPQGNWLRQPVYKRGRPGADCRNNNDGLCV